MNRFERILRAAVAALDLGDFALDSVDSDRLRRRSQCRRAAAAAGFVDMHEKIGEAALDGFEIAEACVRGVKPLDQLRDAIFEMAERGMIGVGELHPFELLDEPGQELFQLARHRMAGFRRGA
jgi:hypothetical protein